MALANTQPTPARTVTLGKRRDGVSTSRETLLFLLDEVAPCWIETAYFCGGVFIDSADNAAVDPGSELSVANVTVQGTKVELWVDATGAIADSTYTVTVEVHPDANQTIIAEFDVVTEADA